MSGSTNWMDGPFHLSIYSVAVYKSVLHRPTQKEDMGIEWDRYYIDVLRCGISHHLKMNMVSLEQTVYFVHV